MGKWRANPKRREPEQGRALKEGLCPCQALLEQALAVRKAPLRYQDQLEDAAELESDILGYADVLAEELAKRAAF